MPVFSQTPPPPPLEPGVSRDLARWRAAHYSDVRYKLNITLEKQAPLMRGEIEIRVNLTEEGSKHDLILDWRTTAFANDKDKPYANVVGVNDAREILVSEAKEHLIIPKGLLKNGENVIKINFASPIKTSGAAVTRYVDKEDGAEYVYTLFVPSDASTAFPVFDQPDLKARFALTVKADWNWKVITNTNPKSIQTLPTSHSEDAKKQLNETAFEETKPISTYVFAFAAGEFRQFKPGQISHINIDLSKKNSERDQKLLKKLTEDYLTTSIFVRKSQAEKFKAHGFEVFRLNREAVKYLEDYFDYKFPFPKYDLVLIPEFPFGGMEHAGATFLREASVIFPTEPTANDFVSRANLIFHEAAHQWFGDTVTMRWFDDLWLKEGFATFVGYKALEKIMPEYNAWKIFYERSKQAAYLTDATRGTTPIYQEIPNLSAAKSAYGAIVYSKAPSFLKQAEFYLGADKFQTAVRRFLKKHEFKNAEWTDLVKEFEAASGKDLKGWGESWIKNRGLDKYGAAFNSRNDETFPLNLKIKNDFDRNFAIAQKLNTLWVYEDGVKETKSLEVSSKTSEFKFQLDYPYKKEQFAYFFPNYQDYGYGIFLLDEKSRDYVLKNIQNEKDDFLRSMMWGALWDSVREAELNPKAYVELAVKNISVETDVSTIQTILSRVSTAMNYYLSDKQREQLAPLVEKTLLERMSKAETVGQRITFYRAYLNVASSERARQILRTFLESDGAKTVEIGVGFLDELKIKVEVPPLKTKDKFDIVTKLLILENKKILGNKEAEKLLAELEKKETSDDAKRYAFAAKAAIGTAENKARFWNDFVGNKELSESWIEAAFVPFNSIHHADLTLPYLEKALAELPNLKRNRKIFFVNGWLGAFIGGQKDEKALQMVNKFLADNPNLDKDLRLKILENVDALERAVRIRAKYGQN
jgi:aminopeptidase N